MTLRINGKTLTRHESYARRKYEWICLLRRNAASKLNRLVGLVEVKPSSLKPRKVNTLSLVYVGTDFDKDMARIQRVLGATLAENTALVQFSRIAMQVTLELPKVAVAA